MAFRKLRKTKTTAQENETKAVQQTLLFIFDESNPPNGLEDITDVRELIEGINSYETQLVTDEFKDSIFVQTVGIEAQLKKFYLLVLVDNVNVAELSLSIDVEVENEDYDYEAAYNAEQNNKEYDVPEYIKETATITNTKDVKCLYNLDTISLADFFALVSTQVTIQ